MKKIIGIIGFLAAVGTLWIGCQSPVQKEGEGNRAPAQVEATISDPYHGKIQPLFDRRCVACHGCYTSPCQLNLQSYEGLMRGASKTNPYGFTSRFHEIVPTRMWIDGNTEEDWRAKKFFDVTSLNSSSDPNGPNSSLLLQTVRQRIDNPSVMAKKPVQQSWNCPSSLPEWGRFLSETHMGMPYGFPPLTEQEYGELNNWISQKGPVTPLPIEESEQLTNLKIEWQQFLNQNSDSERRALVSRYLYEHLFLAHIYFTSETGAERSKFFYRLVRSSKTCENSEEIATRRPSDEPGTTKVYYCLRPVTETVVEKNHIPFEISAKRMARFQKLFYEPTWKTSGPMDYSVQAATNPLVAFKDIPGQSRYRFLIENSHYFVSTFIKGPVCRGNSALNSIQEHFQVFFLSPEADPYSNSKGIPENISAQMVLPAFWGSNKSLLKERNAEGEILKLREKYRKARIEFAKASRPKGYSLEDIWDGDGTNDNAVLTVFRHFDSAFVSKGAIGDAPKTTWVLDYSIFERVLYDLTVGYDLYANNTHQMLARAYMALIRMEAEENFLQFLPREARKTQWESWYRGSLLTKLKMHSYSFLADQTPTAVKYDLGNPDFQAQLRGAILFQRMNSSVGKIEAMTWARTKAPAVMLPEFGLNEVTKMSPENLAAISFFPDFSFLRIVDGQGVLKGIYSVIRNKEMQNLTWMMAEGQRRDTKTDTLTIVPGIFGSYPNMFFQIKEEDVRSFVSDIKALQKKEQWSGFLRKYGVLRSDSTFWEKYDSTVDYFRRKDPIHSGVIDLSRYQLAN